MKYIKTYSPGIIVLVFLVLTSLFTYKDYGISWDEPLTREMGYVYYNYVFNGDQKLVTYVERDHGSGFELPLICLEKMLNISDSKAAFEMRHLATHLFFLFSGFCSYLLLYRLFKKQHIACLGFLLFILHPKLYAHSFFNSKDIPFLSMFMVSLAVCQVAFSKNKTVWYMLLGAACGYTCSIRIPGIILTAVFSTLFFIDIILAFVKKEKPLVVIKNFVLFIVSFCLILILFWPTLWSSPLNNFIECYGFMSHFRWIGTILFNGTIYPGDKLPWQYLPGWFAVSTPILCVLSGFAGIVLVLFQFIKKPGEGFQNTPTRFLLLCMALFILPLLMVILLHSIVYDDWRHVYFIYAPFIVLVMFVLNRLSVGIGKWIVWSACVVQVGILGFFIATNLPFQSVYFNEFVPRDKEYIRKHYEMDYWGSTLKQGLEFVLAHDTASSIRVAMQPTPYNMLILSEQDRKRIVPVELDEHPDYYMTTFRTHPDDYEFTNIVFERKVLNSTVLRVYKLHP